MRNRPVMRHENKKKRFHHQSNFGLTNKQQQQQRTGRGTMAMASGENSATVGPSRPAGWPHPQPHPLPRRPHPPPVSPAPSPDGATGAPRPAVDRFAGPASDRGQCANRQRCKKQQISLRNPKTNDKIQKKNGRPVARLDGKRRPVRV